jgi:hypothetical protein
VEFAVLIFAVLMEQSATWSTLGLLGEEKHIQIQPTSPFCNFLRTYVWSYSPVLRNMSLLRSWLISLSWPWNHERNWKYIWATFPAVRKQPLVHLSPIRARTSPSFWVGTGAELKYSFIFFDTAPSSENCGTLHCGFYCFTSLCSSVMTEYFLVFSHQLIRYPQFLKQRMFFFF